MNAWYALHVRSSQERLVVDRLEARGLSAFYPYYTERSRDRRRAVERKFFPGYVFVSVDLLRRSPLIGIPQIVGIVGVGPRPEVIPPAQIEAARILASSPLAGISAPCPFLAKGERVRIKWGPLVGLEGFVLRDPQRARLVVSVEALGQSRSVEVDRDAIALIQPVAAAA